MLIEDSPAFHVMKLFSTKLYLSTRLHDKSGYKYKLKFEPPQEKKKKQRKREITFYNTPFNAASTINLGK